jgi:hypothetical protein
VLAPRCSHKDGLYDGNDKIEARASEMYAGQSKSLIVRVTGRHT